MKFSFFFKNQIDTVDRVTVSNLILLDKLGPKSFFLMVPYHCVQSQCVHVKISIKARNILNLGFFLSIIGTGG